jgi:predicted exporter
MTHRGAAAVAVWAVAIGAAGIWLVRALVVTTDLSAFLPAAATPTQTLLVDQLRDGVASRLILVGIDGASPDALARSSKALAAELAQGASFLTVTNGDLDRLGNEQALVRRWRYVLSPAVEAGRFTAEGLRAALSDALRALASPLAPMVKRTLPFDPTAELLAIAPLLAGADTATRTLHDGVWFSADQRRALLIAQTRAPAFDLDGQEAAVLAIRSAFARVAPADARLTMSSPGLLAVESRARIERDARFASLTTLGCVVLLLFATYRSIWPTVLSSIPALTGLAIGVTTVGLVFGPVHAITLGFGAMLIGEAIDYPTYLFANNAAGESLEATQARIGGTLLLAAATTASGALAMLLSGFRGLAQLGLLIVTGVVVAGLVTRYVLPVLTPARALVQKRAKPPLDASRALPMLRRHAWLVGIAIAAATAILVAKRDAIWDDDLANLDPVSAAAKASDRELRMQLGAPDLRYLVVVTGADREAALRASEAAAAKLDGAVLIGLLAGYDHPARYLPSEATQRRRIDALPAPAALRQNLDAALVDSPFRADAFEPFLVDVERTRTGGMLTREHLEGTALAGRVDTLLARANGGWVALLPLAGVADPAALPAQLGGLTLLDLKQETDALVAGYRARSLWSTAIGLGCLVIVVYAGLRSLRATVATIVPVLAAVLLTAATLVGAGEKLTVFHLVALLLIVGVGLNYALFFGRRHASAAERDLTLLSVSVAGLATLCASTVLALTGTPVLRAIGLTTGLGAVFAFVVSAAFVRER